jgi:type IV secretory pathway TraG/TraD family ATPase VirD4
MFQLNYGLPRIDRKQSDAVKTKDNITAPTRSGKGISCVTPALSSYQGVVVADSDPDKTKSHKSDFVNTPEVS